MQLGAAERRGGHSVVIRNVVTIVSCAGLFTLAPNISRACGGSICNPDQFVPRSGQVPASLDAIAWWPGTDWSTGLDTDGGGSMPLMTGASDLVFECGSAGNSKRKVSFAVEGDTLPRR